MIYLPAFISATRSHYVFDQLICSSLVSLGIHVPAIWKHVDTGIEPPITIRLEHLVAFSWPRHGPEEGVQLSLIPKHFDTHFSNAVNGSDLASGSSSRTGHVH